MCLKCCKVLKANFQFSQQQITIMPEIINTIANIVTVTKQAGLFPQDELDFVSEEISSIFPPSCISSSPVDGVVVGSGG